MPAVDGVALPAELRIEPTGAHIRIDRRGPGHFAVAVRGGLSASIHAAGLCPAPLDAPVVRLKPLFVVNGERAQVGYGAEARLDAVPQCQAAEALVVRWNDNDGVVAEGRRVTRTMPSMQSARVGAEPVTGVVPISPASRGSLRLHLNAFEGDELRFQQTLLVHAAARFGGVPSVPLRTRVYLRGHELQLLQQPMDSEAQLVPTGEDLFSLIPDEQGRYVFGTASNREEQDEREETSSAQPPPRGSDGRDGGVPPNLGNNGNAVEVQPLFSIRAGGYVRTPLDCGRSECHQEATTGTAHSPMTSALARAIEDEDYTPGCALGCHTIGEPGVGDEGFSHVARNLGFAAPHHGYEGAWNDLPRELRRLGGVGCPSCHGPGAIPEAGARWKILSTDVCAVCHDAPPRYTIVQQWRRSRMAQPEDETKRAEECRTCHTTAGYLGVDMNIDHPLAKSPLGIACAACHDPHPAAAGEALLRDPPPLASPFDDVELPGQSRICVSCHFPRPDRMLPEASAAALLLGRGSYDAQGHWAARTSPHGALERGCMSCHSTHAWQVDEDVCSECHEARPPPPDLAEQLGRLDVAERGATADTGTRAPNPDTTPNPHTAPETAAERARWNATLVGADRGAWAHGGSTTLEILRDAAQLAGLE